MILFLIGGRVTLNTLGPFFTTNWRTSSEFSAAQLYKYAPSQSNSSRPPVGISRISVLDAAPQLHDLVVGSL